MKGETYIDHVRLIPGTIYPPEGKFVVLRPVHWHDKDGIIYPPCDDAQEVAMQQRLPRQFWYEDEDAPDVLPGYCEADFFTVVPGEGLRFKGSNSVGLEPVFFARGPVGEAWPVAWQWGPIHALSGAKEQR